MAQHQVATSMADVSMSANARQQFQQYLSRIPASPSSTSSSSSDVDTLLKRSASLTNQVDSLHHTLSDDGNPSSSRADDPQLFWSTLTLLTNLRDLSARLQRTASDRRVNEALARTHQNIGIAESLLRLLSISHDGGASDAFTAPVRSTPIVSAPVTQDVRGASGRGYEYWKQQTLSALDSDDIDALSAADSAFEDDDGAVSDADSVLTDPNIHLAPPATTTKSSSDVPLAGIKPSSHDRDADYSEYDRALATQPKPRSPPPAAASGPAAPSTTTASDTILQSDRATHEALSSELLRMASVLKSNSLAFADALERDRLLLEKAGTDLSQNLDLMTRTRGRLGVYSKKARSMGWFTLSAIAIVLLSWMLMFLLIRLT